MELERVLEVSRRIGRDVAGPGADEVDREARWPEQGVRALQAAGLGGLVVPSRFGGLGHGLLGLTRVCEELGRHCASTSLCFGMHCVGAAVLAAKPTDVQAERFLAPIAAGEHLTTLALSEPGTGVHFYFPECVCRAQPDGTFLLNGRKSFVTNGGHADSYVVSVLRQDLPSLPTGRFSCVVVEEGLPGLSWGAPWVGLGLRGNSSRELELADVALPAEHLLGSEGDQLWYVFQVVAPYFLLAMAGTYLGIAQAAFDACRAHVEERRYDHSGRGLAHAPVVQHKLGTLYGVVARSRALLYEAAAQGDRGEEQALPAILTVKAEIGDCVNHVVGEAMTLMGGRAYRAQGVMHRLLRDARAAHVMSPTTDLLRQWVGRALLDLSLLGE